VLGQKGEVTQQNENEDRDQIRVEQEHNDGFFYLSAIAVRILMPGPWLIKVGLVAFNPFVFITVTGVEAKVAHQVDKVVLHKTPHNEKVSVANLVFTFPLKNSRPVHFCQLGDPLEERYC